MTRKIGLETDSAKDLAKKLKPNNKVQSILLEHVALTSAHTQATEILFAVTPSMEEVSDSAKILH